MYLYGLLRLGCFLTTWVVGALSIPVALLAAFFYQVYIPAYIIIAYYTYRAILPAGRWQEVKGRNGWFWLNEYPYCNIQQIVFTDGAKPPEPKSKTMLAVSPHGILTLGFVFAASSAEFDSSEIKWLVTDMLLQLPFIRDFMLWIDAVAVNKKSMTSLLGQGHNVALLPGGFEEATIYIRDKHKLFIKDRKGFVKYALQYGYSIQPSYVFGEERGYWQFNIGSIEWRFWLNKHRIPTIFFMGKFGILPDNNIDVSVVVGKPFKLPLIEKPTKVDVDKWHNVYIENMVELFEKNKEKYAYKGKDAVLELY